MTTPSKLNRNLEQLQLRVSKADEQLKAIGKYAPQKVDKLRARAIRLTCGVTKQRKVTNTLAEKYSWNHKLGVVALVKATNAYTRLEIEVSTLETNLKFLPVSEIAA